MNKDNPKLSCRLKNLKKFSPIRIILDNNLETNTKSYVFKTANKNNTIIFYNEAKKSRILEFKKKIKIIKSKTNNQKEFNISIILKKLYQLGCRNLLVEGGNHLTKNFLKKKIYNKFYLFKSSKKLSKSKEYKEFNGFNILKKNYKNKYKIKSNFGKDTITLYKN